MTEDFSRATAVTRGWGGGSGGGTDTAYESAQKSTLEKKIRPPLLPGLELATFRSESDALTNKLSRLPI